MVVIGVIIATLILGARCYFLKKAKGEHSPFIASCQAALPGKLTWRWGASASWEACALVQWELRACGWWHLFSSWGVTFLTEDVGFGGCELLLPLGVSQAWVKAFAFWVGLPGKDKFGGECCIHMWSKVALRVGLWPHLVLQLVELGMSGDTPPPHTECLPANLLVVLRFLPYTWG